MKGKRRLVKAMTIELGSNEKDVHCRWKRTDGEAAQDAARQQM
jgi:hypothetical protein